MTTMQKLMRTAADTARAHRDAMRLLLQGIDDAMRGDDEASEELRSFFINHVSHDTCLETYFLSDEADTYSCAVMLACSTAAASEISRKGGSRESAQREVDKLNSIAAEVKDRVSNTCPCRGCTQKRDQAIKVVDDCLSRVREKLEEKR